MNYSFKVYQKVSRRCFVTSFYRVDDLVSKASTSHAQGTWFEYGRGWCDQSLNSWYRPTPQARRSALKVSKG